VLAILTASLATGITNSSVIPAVAAQSSATEFSASPQLGAGVPVQIVKEIKTITSTAVVDGVKRGLDFALVFAFISFFVALGFGARIRNRRFGVVKRAVKNQSYLKVFRALYGGY